MRCEPRKLLGIIRIERLRFRYLMDSILYLPTYLKLKRQWLEHPEFVTGGQGEIYEQWKSWVRKEADNVYWNGFGYNGQDSLSIVLSNWTLRYRNCVFPDGHKEVLWSTSVKYLAPHEEVFVHGVYDARSGALIEGRGLIPASYVGDGMARLDNGTLVQHWQFWSRKPDWERE